MSIAASGFSVPADVSGKFIVVLRKQLQLIQQQQSTQQQQHILVKANQALGGKKLDNLHDLQDEKKLNESLSDPVRFRTLLDVLGLTTKSIAPVVQLFLAQGKRTTFEEAQSAFAKLDSTQVDLEIAHFGIPLSGEHVYSRGPVLYIPGEAGLFFYLWGNGSQSITHSHVGSSTGDGSHELGLVTHGALREERFIRISRRVEPGENSTERLPIAQRVDKYVLPKGGVSYLKAGGIHRVAADGEESVNHTFQAFWPLEGGVSLQRYSEAEF